MELTRTQADREIIPVLSYVLKHMVTQNDKVPPQHCAVTIFHAGNLPAISIQDYLERMMKYAPCSTECFIMGLVYIDRIIHNNKHFLLTSFNVHRLLITGVMLAAKFFDDCYYNNAYYAKVGGVPCTEMNILELEFLFLIKFSLNVSSDIFQSYKQELMKHSLRLNGAPLLRSPTSPTASSSPSNFPVSPRSSNYQIQQITPYPHQYSAQHPPQHAAYDDTIPGQYQHPPQVAPYVTEDVRGPFYRQQRPIAVRNKN
jgi:hypothetical protein